MACTTTQHLFLPNNRNALSTAVVSATSTHPSAAIRRSAVLRQGNGTAQLTGPYTGALAATVDVEIVSGTGTPRASTPVFNGVGSGTITNLTALSGATAQSYTIALIDAGTRTEAAKTDLEGYTLRAKATGASGNSIEVTVDQDPLLDPLVFSQTDYSLIAILPEDTAETGEAGLDFGTAIAVGDEVPADAKRLVFGEDRSTIYRQWKKYVDGEWTYFFAPAIQRAYPVGARVYEVTGSRSVTVTDGVTPEVYTGIVTLYNLLSQIDADSALLEVDPLPSPDMTADNLAAVLDLRTQTDARIDWTTGDTRAPNPGFRDMTAGTTAATELVTAECFANNTGTASLGRELWTLRGSVSGALGDLRTDERYVHPLNWFGMRVPQFIPPGASEPIGGIGVSITYATRGVDEIAPPICVDERKKGASAVSKAIRFVYTRRPNQGDCACDLQTFQRLPRMQYCLNLDAPGEEQNVMATLDTEYQSRLEDLYEWRSDFVAGNAALGDDAITVDDIDIDIANATANLFAAALAMIYEDSAGRTEWDAALVDLEAELADFATMRAATYGGESALNYDATFAYLVYVGRTPPVFVRPSTASGLVYTMLTSPGVASTEAAGTEPTWGTTIGGISTSGGGIRFECYARYWTASTAQSLNDTVTPYNGHTYTCSTAGTTGSAPPAWPTALGATVTDGTVVWTNTGEAASGTNATDELPDDVGEYAQKWQARMDYVLSLAGIVPSFSGAGTTGTSCWQDDDSAYWWEPQDSGYLPAFTNVQYVSVKRDNDGEIYPTHEFSFVFKVKDDCIAYLMEGDTVEIGIDGAGAVIGYQIGDTLSMAVIAASALALGGGVDGTDEQTWSVRRTVDGAGTDYTQDIDTPALYDDGDVQFRLMPGGIDDEIGDYWSFCVESGLFKWRKDAGSWSADISIDDTSLTDGLALSFAAGACPSFVADDAVSWDVLQPHALNGALAPDGNAFAWTGAATTLTLAITGSVDTVALAMHTLPSTAVVTVADGVALSEVLTWREGPMVLPIDTALINPTITITITNATGGSVGWLWAGEALRAGYPAQTQLRRKRWNMIAGAGRNPRNGSDGAGWGYALTFKPFESANTVSDLLDAIDNAKATGDAPVLFVPHCGLPSEAELVRWPDVIDLDDWVHQYWEQDPAARRHPLTLELLPWYY